MPVLHPCVCTFLSSFLSLLLAIPKESIILFAAIRLNRH
jgi:hypothetical protein